MKKEVSFEFMDFDAKFLKDLCQTKRYAWLFKDGTIDISERGSIDFRLEYCCAVAEVPDVSPDSFSGYFSLWKYFEYVEYTPFQRQQVLENPDTWQMQCANQPIVNDRIEVEGIPYKIIPEWRHYR